MIVLVKGTISEKISEENELPSRLLVVSLFGLEIYAMCLGNKKYYLLSLALGVSLW